MSQSLMKKLGPGLLYAAAAIGVSHLVQSTRAGAQFGYQLLWAIVLANLIKYPFFKVGATFTAFNKKSLLQGYLNQGRWTIYLFILITLGTMFVVQSAVTIVTAGLAINLFGLSLSAPVVSAILLALCVVILLVGKYQILDHLIKFIVIILTIATLISIICAFTTDFAKPLEETPFDWANKAHLFFLIALIGWMPAPMDIPVWHSLWTLQKKVDDDRKLAVKNSVLDFNIGYYGTAILAVCFLALGSIVMYRSGVEFSASAVKFSSQLIEMYTNALGDWAYYPIAISAFTTMFSTTLTCLDAFPRILEESHKVLDTKIIDYKKWLLTTMIGALVILFNFVANMKQLVDFATILSFLVGPFYAIMNYKVMTSSEYPEKHRPAKAMKVFCLSGITFLVVFSLYFLFLKLT